jgi:hypothetical protein
VRSHAPPPGEGAIVPYDAEGGAAAPTPALRAAKASALSPRNRARARRGRFDRFRDTYGQRLSRPKTSGGPVGRARRPKSSRRRAERRPNSPARGAVARLLAAVGAGAEMLGLRRRGGGDQGGGSAAGRGRSTARPKSERRVSYGNTPATRRPPDVPLRVRYDDVESAAPGSVEVRRDAERAALLDRLEKVRALKARSVARMKGARPRTGRAKAAATAGGMGA